MAYQFFTVYLKNEYIFSDVYEIMAATVQFNVRPDHLSHDGEPPKSGIQLLNLHSSFILIFFG